jgi:TPR repeat protein
MMFTFVAAPGGVSLRPLYCCQLYFGYLPKVLLPKSYIPRPRHFSLIFLFSHTHTYSRAGFRCLPLLSGRRGLALAVRFFRMAAEGGDTLSQVSLARLYRSGEGVERDERMASAWLLRAAREGGDAVAQYRTATRYKQGLGYDAPNIKAAIQWFQAAVAQGHAGAQVNLGNCYDDGDGVTKNPRLALKLWRKCGAASRA